MTRRYIPGEHLATVLAGRVDALEQDVRQVSQDVTALGRGVSDLTAQIRHLTTSITPNVTPATSSAASEPGEIGGEDDLEPGQPDWFAVTDPQVARDVLTALTEWVAEIGACHAITLSTPCWALHPDVVADLLAVSTQREHAYTRPDPTPVSEWLTRWLPATADRIRAGLDPCATVRGHFHQGRTYDTTGFDPLSAGTWWATDRDTPAPEAFALPALT